MRGPLPPHPAGKRARPGNRNSRGIRGGSPLRMGQAHVKRWIDDLMPMVTDTSDPLGVTSFATHHLPLEQAPHGYDIFRDKADGCLKVVLQP